MKKPKKQTVDDLRNEYAQLFGKDASIRWNKPTLRKKIRDKQILDEAYSAQAEREGAAQPESPVRKPDFEALAGDEGLKDEDVFEGNGFEDEPMEVDGRGGKREGAGRKVGQTDERARIERLMKLQVPDLIVLKVTMGVCFFFGRLSKHPFSRNHVVSIALGSTRELYYWFPFFEGKTSKWALHCQAFDDVAQPLYERALEIEAAKKQKPEQETEQEIKNGKKVEKKQKVKVAKTRI